MKTILLFFSLSLTVITIAQQTEIELDPVTLTASLQPLQVSKTGRNIISIFGEQFNKLPVHSIDELLRYIPGLEVQMRGPQGSQSDIVLRGGTFQQVLVVLDGLRLNDPNTGHFNSYIPIAPAEIERVEVLKGASSAIYGSEAVGGVIHIITKTFAAKLNDPDHASRQAGSYWEKKQLSIKGIIGEYKLINASLGGFIQNKTTAIGGGFLTNNSDGQSQRGTRGFFYNHTASLSLRHFFNNNWSIAARSSFDTRDFSAQNFYTTFISDTAKEKVNTNWNQLQLIHSRNKHIITLDAGYKAVKDHFAYNPSVMANENRSYLFQSSLTDNLHLAEGSHLVSGLQYQRKWIRSNDRGNHILDQGAAFLILNQSINAFSFSPSLRLDWNERRGTELVPQLNISYKLRQLQLRASIGKTIRDADFTERYNNYNKAFVGGGSIGNPDLEAERSISYEAGADYFVGKKLKLSTSIFQRRHSNLIDWTPTPYSDMPRKENLSPTGNYALAKNISKVTTTGAELDVQFTHSFGKGNKVLSTLGVVWLNSDADDKIPSFYISSHAKFLTNFTIQYSNKWFALSATGIYKNRKPQEATAINAHLHADCFMMNTEAEIFLLQQRLGLFVEVDNVFNNKCSDLLGSQTPGRWLMGGIKLTL